MSAISRGSAMPLFDRLAAAGETQLTGANALRESVARDLGRLLNTRSRLTFEAFGESDGSVIDYGVPDFSERSLRSGGDRDAIAAVIQHAIALFEPRLKDVSVSFAFPAERAPDAILMIGGQIREQTGVGHVAFELAPSGHHTADPRWVEHG
ncbi:type VI secretion system baseplate subunit TssE [Paraburkholderia dipogonis]|uniref:Type VI secretion system baseplate subunit TssE n=1 Tax=Paraburkholderia dipogonis TaxID=1211383 RepID=A0A4Y8MXQ2_9BURK|nr:type VI secretion system baseplate subunit TssE [Paraburkholderia dipogonis]TFE42171.1 type VI secretion system baseplate subunit TssE [Paraburkholderia dipogonis]